MRARTVFSAVTGGIIGAIAVASPASAQAPTEVEVLGTQVNLLWVVIGAVLVIFMQAGFALVETGFCRAKHAAHVVSTNFAIFGLGFIGFFLIGFPSCSAASRRRSSAWTRPTGDHLIGSGNWTFLWQGGCARTSARPLAPRCAGFFLYMVAFMDTVATIPTGAMAERWKWKSFVIWGLFCGAIYYPLFGAWTWGGGWLAKLGNSHEARASATSTSPDPAWCTPSVAWRRWPVPSCSVLASASSTRTARRTPFPGITSRWRCSVPSSCCSGGSASTPHRPSPRPTSASPLVAPNTAIAAAFGSITAMFWIMREEGQARSRDDGQRHAGRPGRHHRTVCLRPAVGGGHGHRHHRRRARHRGLRSSSRSGGIDDPVGAIAVHGVQRPVRRPRRRDLRRRPVRRRLERHDERRAAKGVTGILYGRPGPVSCGARRSAAWSSAP